MATYSKKTCHKCGIMLPQPDMVAKTIQVETGNSRKTFSGSELLFAVLGNEKARKAVGRTFTSPNKRRYVRYRDVWECYKCAGVESPEEDRIQLEKERISIEQVRLAKEKEFLERKSRVENELAIKNAKITPRVLEKEIARDKRISEGSFNRFLVAFIPQFLLSLGLLYIPLSEFYLRRGWLGVLKFIIFYFIIAIIIGINKNINVIVVQMTLPLIMGALDFVSGYKFFRKNIKPEDRQEEPIRASFPPPLPPLTCPKASTSVVANLNSGNDDSLKHKNVISQILTKQLIEKLRQDAANGKNLERDIPDINTKTLSSFSELRKILNERSEERDLALSIYEVLDHSIEEYSRSHHKPYNRKITKKAFVTYNVDHGGSLTAKGRKAVVFLFTYAQAGGVAIHIGKNPKITLQSTKDVTGDLIVTIFENYNLVKG